MYLMNWSLFFIVSEAMVIVILLLLIFFRKIGRPLNEAEAREKINLKREKRRQQQLKWEQELKKISNQEDKIRNMQRPVTFVSLSGDAAYGRTLCVQDGSGMPHTLFCRDFDLRIAPLFNGLYEASVEPHYHSERGAILLK